MSKYILQCNFTFVQNKTLAALLLISDQLLNMHDMIITYLIRFRCHTCFSSVHQQSVFN
jgi:hypothetical protein